MKNQHSASGAKIKKLPLLLALAFLAAGCHVFSTPVPGGLIKSLNGGADWQFANKVASSTTASLSPLSISKLAFDPGNRQIVFAGTYTDGLFKSVDASATWSKILSKIYVYDFAVNPFDSKIIYAAGFFADRARVLKTTDGGASWNEVYSEESANNAVRGIALNPINPNQLVIGTTSGNVVKSSDGGQSWQLAKNFNDRINRVLWQNNNIYVLLKTKGFFSSSDFGVNFVELTASLNKTYSLAGLSYVQNTIDSFSQAYVDFTSPSLIYLTTNKGLYKSVDAGKTWTLQNLPIKPQNSDTHAIAVSRTSSNIVFTSVASTIYKSLDGGSSWQTQSITSGGFINYILIDPQLPQIVYAGIYLNSN